MKIHPKGDTHSRRCIQMSKLRSIALALAIIGALNWGVFAISGFDVIAQISGGSEQLLARILYILIAVAGLLSISSLVSASNVNETDDPRPRINVY
jgi:hypothetical protein